MSESILDHGYVAEEHAPDPVTSHGDPTPPGKVAIWLFLASEIMFFIGLLATYIIFRSGSPKIFADHAAALNKALAGTNTLVLIFSSLTMALAVDAAQKGNRSRTIICLILTLACAGGFMGIKFVEYRDKFSHHTIAAREADGILYVYDGHKVSVSDTTFVLQGHKARVEPGPFDIHWMSGGQVEALAKQQGVHADEHAGHHGATHNIPIANISQNITYGPWKNVFYASYFITTGVHGLHVVGGIVALALLLGHAIRGKLLPPHTEYIGLYWHFVDLVWIFLFPLLYLI
ncbi:MAG: cytochrome c oxidase subunit [Humisphaera sp.]|nr:cytochrome c oxidase subunit [Humisphaera sp.]